MIFNLGNIYLYRCHKDIDVTNKKQRLSNQWFAQCSWEYETPISVTKQLSAMSSCCGRGQERGEPIVTKSIVGNPTYLIYARGCFYNSQFKFVTS